MGRFVTTSGGGSGSGSSETPVGGMLVLPSQMPVSFTHAGATYLRTGAWVRAEDTALVGTPWVTTDGATIGTVPHYGSLHGMRQSLNGEGFLCGGSITTLQPTALSAGVQATLPTIAIPGANTVSTNWGFRVGSRRFVTIYDSGRNDSRLFEYTDAPTMTLRFTAGGTADFSDTRSAASEGDLGLLLGGGGNKLWRTADGGTTWAEVTSPNTGLTRMTSRPGPMFVIASSTSGNVYTSATGTSGSWTTRTLPVSTAVNDVLYTPAGTLLAMTNTAVYRSTDDGATWTLVVSATAGTAAHLVYDHFNARVLLLCNTTGGNTTGWQSTDDGLTWTTTPLVFGTTQPARYGVYRVEAVGVSGQTGALTLAGAVGSSANTINVGTAGTPAYYYLRIA